MGQFQATPTYINKGYREGESMDDVVDILVCQIKIWKASKGDWFYVPNNCLTITEVEEINIHDSYKELIGTADIKLPRGSLMEKLLVEENANPIKDEFTYDFDDNTNSDNVGVAKRTQYGDTLVQGAVLDENGNPILRLNSKMADKGLLQMDENETESKRVDLSVGQRIQVKLGYVHDIYDANQDMIISSAEDKIAMLKSGWDISELKLAFTGFITAVQISSPIEIKCENMASFLKKVNCPKTTDKGDMSVNDFFKSGGKYHLLDGTGISLSPATEETEIKIGKINLEASLTVADLLANWQKSGLFTFMEPDGRHLRIGTIIAGSMGVNTSDKQRIDYQDNNSVNIIYFDWDVANDNMQVSHYDKEYLEVMAKGKSNTDTKKNISVLVRHNPNYGSSDDKIGEEFYVVTENKPKPRKQQKQKKGQKGKGKSKNGKGQKTTTSTNTKQQNNQEEGKTTDKHYSRITIFSSKLKEGTTVDELKKEAIKAWKNHSANGVSGSLAVFGDRDLRPTQIVGLISPLTPEKNGYYMIESVNTSFGSEGYRKEIKLPYKVMNYKDEVKIIWT